MFLAAKGGGYMGEIIDFEEYKMSKTLNSLHSRVSVVEQRLVDHQASCDLRYSNIEKYFDRIDRHLDKNSMTKSIVILGIVVGICATVFKMIGI
jgi:flagellar capping protein FliD